MLLVGLGLCGFAAYFTYAGNKSKFIISEVIENGKNAINNENGTSSVNINTLEAQVAPMLD